MFPKEVELANVVEEIKKNILIINGHIMKVRIKNPVMGVPITFLDKYCPTQFRIVGLDRYVENNPYYGHRFTLNGKETYARILIQKI